MKIIIDGKEAVLKKGTSFEFVSENRAFTGADGYSLSITFPLVDCPENIAIFGNINRADAELSNILFECEIRDVNLAKYGVISIVDLNKVEVKVQFLEGRSLQNFDNTFDDIYINDINVGSFPEFSLSNNPSFYWLGIDHGQEAVALPWVNNSSRNIQNEVVYSNGAYSYHEDCTGLSFQPYLISIVKNLCESLGYSCDVSQWENREDLKYLIICNALPSEWGYKRFSTALPAWTVTEFFEKLELFLRGEFNIDHKAKSITFEFTSSALDKIQPISLSSIVDSFSSEVSLENNSNFIDSSNVKYKECSHNMWKLYCCPWFFNNDIIQNVSTIVYDSLSELVDANKHFYSVRSYDRGSNIDKIFYAKDVDTYFVIRCIRNENIEHIGEGFYSFDRICILQPINIFGDVITDDVNDAIEIEFVPAWIEETDKDKGSCIYLDIEGEFESLYTDDDGNIPGTRPSNKTPNDGSSLSQPGAMQNLNTTAKYSVDKEIPEYFDRIYLGYWKGFNNNVGYFPRPDIDSFTIREDWSFYNSPCSLRLPRVVKNKIDSTQKFKFSFLMDVIPNVRSVFFIQGKKYLCEKITATFTENGMSQLLKGEFYRIVD